MLRKFYDFCGARSWYTICVFVGFCIWAQMVLSVGAKTGMGLGLELQLLAFYAVPAVVGYLGGRKEAEVKQKSE